MVTKNSAITNYTCKLFEYVHYEGYGFKQVSLGWGIEIREAWLRTGYHLPGN